MSDKKHEELAATIGITIATKFTSVNQSLHTNKLAIDKNQKDIQDLKETMNYQSKQIHDQEKEIADLNGKLALGDLIARKEARAV